MFRFPFTAVLVTMVNFVPEAWQSGEGVDQIVLHVGSAG